MNTEPRPEGTTRQQHRQAQRKLAPNGPQPQLKAGTCKVKLGTEQARRLIAAGVTVFAEATTIGNHTFAKGDCLALGRHQCRAMARIMRGPRPRWVHCKPSGTVRHTSAWQSAYDKALALGSQCPAVDASEDIKARDADRRKLRNAAKRERRAR